MLSIRTPVAPARGSCSRRSSRPRSTTSTASTMSVAPQPFYEPPFPSLDSPASTSSDVQQYRRERPESYAVQSMRDTGTLRPGPEWYPAWMVYRRRESNYVFWQEKFSRCSIDVQDVERRWTVFSTLWFTVMEFKYFVIPPAIRFLFFIAYRAGMERLYVAHKSVVLWHCKVDAYIASRGTDGKVETFSKAMALRRLHWKNSLVGEALYALNIAKTGRVHLLPPQKRPAQRPTFFWLF